MAGADYEDLTARVRRMGILVAAVFALVGGLLWVGTMGARRLVERRVARQHAEVVETLRELGEALLTYQQKFGGYPDTLERLRGKEEGPASYMPPERARLLDSSLARDRFEREGYVITYTPTNRGQTWAATVPLAGGYVVAARPAGQATRGVTFFYADQTRALRSKKGAPAGPGDPLVPPSL